jgi:hypothetical protein
MKYLSPSHYGKHPRTLQEAFGPHTYNGAFAPEESSLAERVMFVLAIVIAAATVAVLAYFQ